MRKSDLSLKTVPPIPPACPTCGKEMTLTGVNPSCDGTTYDYQCSNDGDRLSWRPYCVKNLLAAYVEDSQSEAAELRQS